MSQALRGITNALSNTPITISTIFDGVGVNCGFEVHSIYANPPGKNAVYMMCRANGLSFEPLYIGKADDLADRLSGHERKTDALQIGATHLLIHKVGQSHLVGHVELERRLIGLYNPPLNAKHRTIGNALMGIY